MTVTEFFYLTQRRRGAKRFGWRSIGMEPTGQVGTGLKIKQRLAERFNGRERELADGLLLSGRERAQV
jgi:hypothetical protein